MSLTSQKREVEEAIELADEVLDLGKCDNFAESCKTKFTSFLQRLEDGDLLTDKQLVALSNMVDGLKKWVRD